MESTRNNQGRFVTGHKGSKPKGAINKSTREYLARLERLNELLETTHEDDVSSLSKKERVLFWLEMQKFMHVKLSNLPNPIRPKNLSPKSHSSLLEQMVKLSMTFQFLLQPRLPGPQYLSSLLRLPCKQRTGAIWRN